MEISISNAYFSTFIFALLILLGVFIFNFGIKRKLITPLILFIIGFAAKPFIDSNYVTTFVFMSLIILVFDAGSTFIPRGFDNLSKKTVKLIITSLCINSVLCLILLYISIFKSITIESIVISILAGVLITASTQHDLIGLERKKHKESIILEIEDNLSNPIVIFIGVILVDFINLLEMNYDSSILSNLIIVGQHILIDAGIGILLGMILLTVVVRFFNREKILIPAVILAVIGSVISFYFNSTGLISVLVMSLFFHNIIDKRNVIEPYSSNVSHIAYICIFLLMGASARMSSSIIITSLSILIVYLFMRHFIAVELFPNHAWSFTLDCQKGLAIGAFAAYIILRIWIVSPLETIMQIIIWISIFSIIISYSTKLHDHKISERNAIKSISNKSEEFY